MTINWIIERLLVKPVEGTLTDVVITADWRCNGTDGTYSGTCYGSTSFAPPLPWLPPVPPLVEQKIPVLQPHQIVDPLNLPTSDVPPSGDGMSTNFVYGSGNPLFQAPKKETKKETKKPTETKAQIDARIATSTQKLVEA